MADSFVTDPGSGGVTFASDDIGGTHWPRVKVTFGADGSATDASSANPLPVQAQANDGVDIGDVSINEVQGSVDSNNSTTSTLGGSATFTGTATDVTNSSSVAILLFSDQDSATNGLSLEFSSDGGTNWDFAETHTITANQSETYVLPTVATHFRVVYTNGTTAQGAFRLETILHPTAMSQQTARLESTVSGNEIVTLSRAILSGKDPGGTYQNIEITNGGNLKVGVEGIEGIAGQATMANSFPVVIASDQSSLDVSGATVTTTPAVTGGGTEAAAQRVTIANDSTGVVSIDDNGGSLTVDGTITANAGTGTFTIQEATALDVSAATVTIDGAHIATEGSALGSGVLLQGDDGTDRKNVAVDATSGNIQVDISTFPDNEPFNVAQVGGNAVNTGAGNAGTGTQRVVVASDQAALDVSGATVTVDQSNDEARLNGVVRKDIDPSDGATQLTTKFAVINASTSGDNSLVAAVASKKIRVLSYVLSAAGDVTAKFQSSTAGDITGPLDLTTNSGVSASAEYGLFETTAGEALQLNLDGAVTVGGHLSYVEV